jgi:hypothetical protein
VFFYCIVIIIFYCKTSFSAENKLMVAIFLEPPYLTLVNDQLIGEHVDIVNLLASAIKFKPALLNVHLCAALPWLNKVRQI